MTKEQKAENIALDKCRYYGGEYDSYKECFDSALEMAQWKDEQFKQILQVIYSKTLSIEKDVVIEQIYKKLFGEDLDRNDLEKDELKNILEKIKNVEL